MSGTDFVALVPVKPLGRGKSRLAAYGDEQRVALADAFVRDTLDATTAATRVAACLVVTDDFRLAASLAAELPGPVAVIPDGVADDLNGCLVLAAAEARRRWPALRPVALCADLPALTPEALDAALEAVARTAPDTAAFVPDRAGTGTTLYSAPTEAFGPRFGVDSCERHRAAGATEVTDVPEVVRLDVDDIADLSRALVVGVGARTAAASGRA